ncbi:hypothetical protein Tco_0652081 [Tanacetum coccineum]|uniref:Uncharacterized protein n=1 Tax=Tanacetum coccineum TaxID=301880 RepID=A0ABQ4WWK9_9ASTR
MDELHRAVAPFIHSSGGGLPGGSMGHGGGGSAPFDVGFFAGNENADPADMGAAEQHQNIARREWDELRSSREWRSVENHFARCDRKIDAIFEKARSMYRDGHLALDIEDESDIKRGLDAYFSDLHDFPSGRQLNRKCHKSTGNAIGSDHKEGGLGLLASLSDSCASRGEPASSGVAFHPKHTTAINACSSLSTQGKSPYKVLLLPSLTSKGKGVKLNASLAHSERISTLDEVEKDEAGPSPSLEISCFEVGLAR